MTRPLYGLSLGLIALLPTGNPVYGWPCGPVYYYPPVVYYPPPVLLPPCPPVMELMPAAAPARPRVQVEPSATPAPADPPKKNNAAPAEETRRPEEPDVRPAAATIPAPATPIPAVPPPATSNSIELPKPRPVVPESPKVGLPTLPAIPATTPAPAAPDVGKITVPAMTPRGPGDDTAMPPLKLPTLSESKYSPLFTRPRVQVYPVAGPGPADPAAKRLVNFFNHSDRDVALTVQGETITLPKRSSVSATVPPAFTFKLDGGADRTETVPAASPGVEVVIRR